MYTHSICTRVPILLKFYVISVNKWNEFRIDNFTFEIS